LANRSKEAATEKQQAVIANNVVSILGCVKDIRASTHGEGTLKDRASLLAAEMFGFVAVTFQAWPMDTFTMDLEDGGRVHATGPSSDYGVNATREFTAKFGERLARIMSELKDRGIDDGILNQAAKTYADDFTKTDWLARRLAEIANGLTP
jgi:hypothetical protein